MSDHPSDHQPNPAANERAAMLFCAPLPPVRLGDSESSFIGRHPSCELSVRRDDVSRKHAEVRPQDGRFVLVDLKSTNGTFVNGERVVDTHALSAGDRIEIGSSTITFCEVDCSATPVVAERDEARTVIFERPVEAPRLSFSGELNEIPPFALFQLMEMGSNTGMLEIASSIGSCSIWFDAGRPVHAKTEKSLGFDAAIIIIGLTSGQFRFGPQPEPVEKTIDASVTELLLEACRQQDESG